MKKRRSTFRNWQNPVLLPGIDHEGDTSLFLQALGEDIQSELGHNQIQIYRTDNKTDETSWIWIHLSARLIRLDRIQESQTKRKE